MPIASLPCPRRALRSLRALLLRCLPLMSPTAEAFPSDLDGGERRPWEPPFDPSRPAPPVSYPIADLQTLASRSYLDSFHLPFNCSSTPAAASGGGGQLPPRRRMLVCHDLQGGYRDDAAVQGGRNPGAYAIWHWYLVDVFVYFSHYLVTLPPPCWTNAAHLHGVKVLGTFITEWDKGREICEEMLATKASAQMYAERLTELAATLGFDGWLINIEVNLDVQQIDNLIEFVDHLTKTMHSAVPGSLVIWYDAVTKAGKLDWQNQLNEYNKPFFDLCDGLFANYSWSANYPKDSATIAGNRKYDVYMGIDVFGRGTYGGGQWNTNVALDLLKKADVSAAIFAPGWVYETNQGPDFETAQNCWWGLVEQSWGVLQSYPKLLPFYSNFDRGHGYHVSVEGLRVSDDPWNNISCQGFQPILNYGADHVQPSMKTFINFQDTPYSGGGSLTVKGSLRPNAIFSTQLFNGGLSMEDGSVHLFYSVKSDAKSAVGLSLELSSRDKGRTTVLITNDISSFSAKQQRFKYNTFVTAEDVPAQVPTGQEWVLYKANVPSSSDDILTSIAIVCALKTPSGIEPETEESGTPERTENGSVPYGASLGHISIRNAEQSTQFPPADSWATEGDFVSWSNGSDGSKLVSLKISWKLMTDHGTSFAKYSIYVEKLTADPNAEVSRSYLGVARVGSFYISDLDVPGEIRSLKFIVQACGHDGDCQELEESPKFELVAK